MSAAWLTPLVQLHSSRMFDCEGFTPENCTYYRYRWHFWYEADHVFALPTVAFFMCTIGIFIIGRVISQAYTYRRCQAPPIWRRTVAVFRYLSYRGFHIKALQWNTASVGVLLLGAVGTIFFFCMDLIPSPYYWPSLDFGGSPPLGTRSGWMALACMPFVFATASKTNWITLVTGVTHEKLNVFHRWISYAFFILALMHTFPFIVYHIHWHDMVYQVTESSTLFYWTGIVALIFQAWLTFGSFSTIRSLGYEFFKAMHLFSVVIFILVFFWHCDYTLTSWDYFIATAAVYVPCLVNPWLRTCFEYGGRQRAQVFVEENGFICVTIPANFDWVPGQHCFLRFYSFGMHAFTSHPFTICSLPSMSQNDKSEITFFLRQRNGITMKLYNHALKNPGASVPVLVDGPYGGIDSARYFDNDHLLVVAGGSGAGWMLPFIELFARCNMPQVSGKDAREVQEKEPSGEHQIMRTCARPLSLRVVLATRDTATRVWFHKSVQDLLSNYPSSQPLTDLEIQVYLTGDAEQQSNSSYKLADLERSSSPSSAEKSIAQNDPEVDQELQDNRVTDQELTGRPQLPLIIEQESAQVAESGRSLGVFVCGPETMQNDVRNAVAKENLSIMKNPKSGGVYLHLEHFSWA